MRAGEREGSNDDLTGMPLRLQQRFASLGHLRGDCPEADKAASAVIPIPIDRELTAEQQRFVIDSRAESLLEDD